MGSSGTFALGVAMLVVAVLATTGLAVLYVQRSRRLARRPWLPSEDRPPAGLTELRPSEVAREVEAGLATIIGYLRRRALQS